MSKHKQKDQKGKQEIPASVVKVLEEELIKAKITQIIFEACYTKYIRGKACQISAFTINNTHQVLLYNNCKSIYSCKTMRAIKKHRKGFGDRANRLMKKTGVSWEIAKFAIKKASDNQNAVEICYELASIRKKVQKEHQMWNAKFKKDPYGTMQKLLIWTWLHNKIDLQEKRTFDILKNYLFAD